MILYCTYIVIKFSRNIKTQHKKVFFTSSKLCFYNFTSTNTSFTSTKTCFTRDDNYIVPAPVASVDEEDDGVHCRKVVSPNLKIKQIKLR